MKYLQTHTQPCACAICGAERKLQAEESLVAGSDAELLWRIKNYLALGGLFNPALMDHEKVRDLIMDCQKSIEHHKNIPRAMEAAKRLSAGDYVKWDKAGGGQECEHGYNEGIPCPACDLALVNEYLER